MIRHLDEIKDEEIVDAFANTVGDVASSWAIMLNGNQIKTFSGRSSWHSSAAARKSLYMHIRDLFRREHRHRDKVASFGKNYGLKFETTDKATPTHIVNRLLDSGQVEIVNMGDKEWNN